MIAIYIVLHVQFAQICSFEPCRWFRIKFLRAKKEIDGNCRSKRDTDFLFHFLSVGARNAEHVASTSVYTQVYTLSRSGNPIGQAGPDGQTRLGRVNQRAGDLNQWRRHICWQRLMIRRTRMKPGTRRFQRSDRLETNLTSSFHLAIQYLSRSPLPYHVGSHYYRVYWLIDVDDAVNAVRRFTA